MSREVLKSNESYDAFLSIPEPLRSIGYFEKTMREATLHPFYQKALSEMILRAKGISCDKGEDK